MTNVVLDTSAVMAWLQQEPGWGPWGEHLRQRTAE